MAVIVWYLDLKLPMQSVPIATQDVRSNPAHGDVYSIQHYVKKLSVTCAAWWFSPGIPVSFTSRTGLQDITEILLKVALSVTTLIQLLRNILNKRGA